MTTLRDIPLTLNDGTATTLNEIAPGKLVLLVNTASKCGYTSQYNGLQALQDAYGERGFTVVGAPCNQFKGQEPGSDEDIAEFCSLNFGVDFPLLAKLEVNGEDTHPLYQELKSAEDADGQAGDVAWNFEKFLVDVDGAVVGRVRPVVEPQDAAVVERIEENLPA